FRVAIETGLGCFSALFGLTRRNRRLEATEIPKRHEPLLAKRLAWIITPSANSWSWDLGSVAEDLPHLVLNRNASASHDDRMSGGDDTAGSHGDLDNLAALGGGHYRFAEGSLGLCQLGLGQVHCRLRGRPVLVRTSVAD